MEQPDITEISIGPDKVLIAGDRVIIYAAQAMTEWTVREFRRPPIFFRDKILSHPQNPRPATVCLYL